VIDAVPLCLDLGLDLIKRKRPVLLQVVSLTPPKQATKKHSVKDAQKEVEEDVEHEKTANCRKRVEQCNHSDL
jgi:hypothetical protein